MCPLLTVLNVIKLLLLLILGIIYFTGLGWLIIELIFHSRSAEDQKHTSLFQRMPLAITLGFIVNYGILLVLQALPASLLAGIVVSMIGVWRLVKWYYKNRRIKEPINQWLGTIFICLLFISPIQFQPLEAWDARSIWFFHAKMIYTAGSAGLSAGWQHPSVIFSHTDYPNLVPGMAAQVACIVGYWNEYIPKISLFYSLVPIVMWLFTFARKSFSFGILILLFPFSIYQLMWNGYMDGYLALYVSLAFLLLGRYIQRNSFIDLISNITCLAILPYFKNEGQLVALAGILSIVMTDIIIKKSGRAGIKTVVWGREKVVAAAILIAPFILWGFYKLKYGLTNDLQIGTAQSITRIIERINDNSYSIILDSTYTQIEAAFMLFGLLYFSTILQKRYVPTAVIPALSTAVVCYIGMALIYLLTPNDLHWHINSSVDRTMLPISGCIFVACYFMLDSLENSIDIPG